MTIRTPVETQSRPWDPYVSAWVIMRSSEKANASLKIPSESTSKASDRLWLMLVKFGVLSLIAAHPSCSPLHPAPPPPHRSFVYFCSLWVMEPSICVPELATLLMSVSNDLIPAQHVWDKNHCIVCCAVLFCVYVREIGYDSSKFNLCLYR